jgi:hypothetical protein
MTESARKGSKPTPGKPEQDGSHSQFTESNGCFSPLPDISNTTICRNREREKERERLLTRGLKSTAAAVL